ncbi:hypothetical protein GCM10007939_07990 [Amylibacter marinus]|uniref:Peptidase propeptide and YPEB domain-containing protein n=1 Tax=Amylibacter marinus TaxID=1475483 RepID=A0ABQ5VT22_9RHOB|nr:hypothetical protein [Amylibacter marinus]GLQ34516.1 hypothetical protein GCM10007939_07990 [Amylibacter marinus]
MTHKFLALSLGFALCVMASNAKAQQVRCAERGEVIANLAKKYGETRQNIGLGRNNGIIETYASEETGTWTILITAPNGQSCLIAAGDHYENLNEPAITRGDDT